MKHFWKKCATDEKMNEHLVISSLLEIVQHKIDAHHCNSQIRFQIRLNSFLYTAVCEIRTGIALKCILNQFSKLRHVAMENSRRKALA